MGIAALHPENLGFISTLPYHCSVTMIRLLTPQGSSELVVALRSCGSCTRVPAGFCPTSLFVGLEQLGCQQQVAVTMALLHFLNLLNLLTVAVCMQ